MMNTQQEDDDLQELLEMKSRVEKRISKLRDEKEKIRHEIDSIKMEKDKMRKLKSTDLQSLYQMRIKLAEIVKCVHVKSNYLLDRQKELQNFEVSLQDSVKLSDFEDSVMKIQASIEGAINFYSEDNLQIEFMKRHKAVSDKRIELTKLETQCREMAALIQKEKDEKIRAEEERKKKEEELKTKLEREKIQLTEIDQHLPLPINQVKSNKTLAPQPKQSFLDNSKQISVPQTLPPGKIEFPSSDPTDSASKFQIPSGPDQPAIPETFSQLLNW